MRRLGLFVVLAAAFSWACTQMQELGNDKVPSDAGGSFEPPDGARSDAGGGDDVRAAGLAAFSVSAGGGFSCATVIVGGNGTDALCWGDNLTGQLGQPGTVRSSDQPLPVNGVAKVGSIASGVSQAYAVSKQGGVVYWGAPLALGQWVSVVTPQPLPALADAVDVAVGAQHACAVMRGGTVQCWGENDVGQLGPATTTRSDSAVPVTGITDAERIVGRFSDHTCVVRSGGAVSCWGSNSNGQLGDGNGGPGQFSRAPVSPQGLEPVADLGAGAGTTCAVTTTGKVFCWGDGRSGQLGTGPHAAGYKSKVPVQVPGLANAEQISVGSHVCVKRTDHTVACWGPNDVGQLGIGTNDTADAPADLTGFDAADVSVGMDHTCAVRLDGQVWCWGSNGYGQLGLGHHADGETSNVPQKVLVFTGIK